MSVKTTLSELWNDEEGVILSAELVLIGTILVIGLIVGLANLQNAVVGELNDLGNAIGGADQSYQTTGFVSSGFRQVISLSPAMGYADSPVGSSAIVGDAIIREQQIAP